MTAQAVKAETAEKPAVEKQTNCPTCNKVIKKLKRYYRNGIFYCTKRCWIKSKSPKEEQK